MTSPIDDVKKIIEEIFDMISQNTKDPEVAEALEDGIKNLILGE